MECWWAPWTQGTLPTGCPGKLFRERGGGHKGAEGNKQIAGLGPSVGRVRAGKEGALEPGGGRGANSVQREREAAGEDEAEPWSSTVGGRWGGSE